MPKRTMGERTFLKIKALSETLLDDHADAISDAYDALGKEMGLKLNITVVPSNTAGANKVEVQISYTTGKVKDKAEAIAYEAQQELFKEEGAF